jgi:hypothetical protein
VGVILVIAVPILYGLVGLNGVGLRDDLDIYGRFMSSPLDLLFPLAAVFLTCVPTFHDVGHRFIANTRARVSIRGLVAKRLLLVFCVSFGAFFLTGFVPFLVSYYFWPAIGNPSITPSLYNLTPSQAVLDSFSRHTYSGLLQAGALTFGLVYSLLVALAGATFACLGLVMLLLVRNRILALAIPFVVFLLETIGAALVGEPQFGFLYGIFPFGLAASPAWEALTPLAILVIILAALWIYVLARVRTLPNLA